jgi:hypothetical protein
MVEHIPEHSALLLLNIDNAKTLEDLGYLTLDYYVTHSKIDRKYLDALAARVSWVNGYSNTLDYCGKLIGVTRERMRQVENKLILNPIPLIIAPKIMYQIIGVIKTCSNFDEFIGKLESSKLISQKSNWNPDSIKLLSKLFDVPKFQLEFDQFFHNIELVEIDTNIAKIIRKYRNKLGLIDLEGVANEMGESSERAFKFIEAMYPFTVRSNNLVMASTRRGGAISNVLLKQLTIKTPLTAETLLEGIERACNYRSTPLAGSKDDLLSLIYKLAGSPPSFESVDKAISAEFEFGDTEIWLKNVLSSQSLGMIHRDELTELAINDGVNPSSVGAYLSFSVIIRSLAPGIFTLVGTEIDENTIQNYRNNFLAVYVPVTFEYELINERIMELTITPNSSIYTGGSLSISVSLHDLIADFRFSTECDCGAFNSEADIRIAPSGYWVGFTALLMHSRLFHSGQPGKNLLIEFDFISQIACLKNK